LLFLGLIGTSQQALAQTPNDQRNILTLEKAVQMAKDKHPSMKAAALSLEQQQMLKKSAFDLDKTNLSYSSGQLNSSAIDYQMQVTQSFKFPTTYVAQSRLQGEKITLSEQALAVTGNELERNVRSAWWQLAHEEAQVLLLTKLSNSYSKFATAAGKRFAGGEITLLEKTSAESEYNKILLEQLQAEQNALISRLKLQEWIGPNDNIELPINALVSSPSNNDTVLSGGNPILNYYKQNKAVAEQEWKVQRSSVLPDFSFGYFTQQLDGVQGFNGIQIGIGIPLFFWSHRGKVQAAKIGIEVAQAQFQTQSQAIVTMAQTKQAEADKYFLNLYWYDTQGLKTAEELLRFADKGYAAGEITYVEFLNATDQATDIKTAYLETVNNYMQAITDLNYLEGNW
jgi:cobalt-zinc-cadmium resistance protein CzcA